jgi:maleate isomerase
MSGGGAAMATRKRLGVIVPSSNTVAEEGTLAALAHDGGIAVHFTRLRVGAIGEGGDSIAQFDTAHFESAAMLLADAGVDMILWSGTSASWLGWEADRQVTDLIERRCGVPAVTATTAINGRLARTGAKRIGLVTPYVEAVEARIKANYREIGIDVVAAERLDLTRNTDYARVSPAQIAAMAGRVAGAGPGAIVILCTNLAGAPVVDAVARSTGIPVLDSVRVAAEEAALALHAAADRKKAAHEPPSPIKKKTSAFSDASRIP